MFAIISPIKLIMLICKVYALLVFLILVSIFLYSPEISVRSLFRVVLGGAGVFELILLASAHLFWRKIWAYFPMLNELLFPDLNGDWDMKIHWNRNGAGGVVDAKASIKQSLISVSMEVRSTGSDSETLVVKTAKDSASGRPLIYYFYRVVPKNIGDESSLPYEGASTLKLFNEEGGVLRGNYFTSRNTKGYFELSR